MKLISFKDIKAIADKGFFVTLGLALLSLIYPWIYFFFYFNSNEFSLFAMLLPLIGVVFTLVLEVFTLYRFAPYALFLGNVSGLAFYIYGMYYYISIVQSAIDAQGLSFAFLFTAILIGLALLISIINVFLSQTKEEKNK